MCASSSESLWININMILITQQNKLQWFYYAKPKDDSETSKMKTNLTF